MLTIAVTGGIACGKSYVCSRLLEKFPAKRASRFDSDEIVAELLRNIGISRKIADLDPEATLDGESGLVDKRVLRKLTFENPRFREKLEALLHPLVLERARRHIAVSAEADEIAFVEVPLLYEVSFPLERDLDLVVAASSRTQRSRLSEYRKVDSGIAEKMIEAQMPLQEKINRGDVVVWNDGDEKSLQDQIDHLAGRCAALFEK